MKRSEKTALWASVLAVVPVVIIGAALSVALQSFARGFVLLGAISLIAASAALWRPFATRLLEEGIRSVKLDDAVETAYRRRKLGRQSGGWRSNFFTALCLVLVFLAVAPLLGFRPGDGRFFWEVPTKNASPIPASKHERDISIRKHGKESSPVHSHRHRRLRSGPLPNPEAPPSSSLATSAGQGKELGSAAEKPEFEAEEPWVEMEEFESENEFSPEAP